MKKVVTFGLLLVGAILLFVVFLNSHLLTASQGENTATVALAVNNSDDIPTLALPLRYFTDDSVVWGSVNTVRNSNDKNTWAYATIDGGDAYQSFPTKTITLSVDDFSNSNEQLPPIKSME